MNLCRLRTSGADRYCRALEIRRRSIEVWALRPVADSPGKLFLLRGTATPPLGFLSGGNQFTGLGLLNVGNEGIADAGKVAGSIQL